MTAPLPPAGPLVEPGPAPDWWDETPEQAKRSDDAYWDLDRDYDDPADHYYL